MAVELLERGGVQLAVGGRDTPSKGYPAKVHLETLLEGVEDRVFLLGLQALEHRLLEELVYLSVRKAAVLASLLIIIRTARAQGVSAGALGRELLEFPLLGIDIHSLLWCSYLLLLDPHDVTPIALPDLQALR